MRTRHANLQEPQHLATQATTCAPLQTLALLNGALRRLVKDRRAKRGASGAGDIGHVAPPERAPNQQDRVRSNHAEISDSEVRAMRGLRADFAGLAENRESTPGRC